MKCEPNEKLLELERARFSQGISEVKGNAYQHMICTGISSHLGAKLRDWADRQAGARCTLGQHCPKMTRRPGILAKAEPLAILCLHIMCTG